MNHSKQLYPPISISRFTNAAFCLPPSWNLFFFFDFLHPVSTACFRSSLLLSLAQPTRALLSPPSPLNFQNTMFPGLFGETVEINKLEGSRTTLLRTTAGSSQGKTNKKASWGDGSVVQLFYSTWVRFTQCRIRARYTLNPQLHIGAQSSLVMSSYSNA